MAIWLSMPINSPTFSSAMARSSLEYAQYPVSFSELGFLIRRKTIALLSTHERPDTHSWQHGDADIARTPPPLPLVLTCPSNCDLRWWQQVSL